VLIAIVLCGAGILGSAGVVVLLRNGVFWPLKPPAASASAAAPAATTLERVAKEEPATASWSSSASTIQNSSIPVFRLDPTRQTVVPLPRAGVRARMALTVEASRSCRNSEDSEIASPQTRSLDEKLRVLGAATSELKRPGWRRSRVRAGADVHPGGEDDEFSHAKTNLRSPVACSQLAAPTLSPPAYSLHAPSGAAGETVWLHTRTHTPGESLNLPRPGVLRDAGVLREAIGALRQQDGLRRSRYSSEESSEEDIDSSFASSPAKSVVHNRPARTAESTADWPARASRARVAPPSPGRPKSATARQPWDGRARSRRSDQHTAVSSLIRLQMSLGKPIAPAARNGYSSTDPGSSCCSRHMSEWAPPESPQTTHAPTLLEEDGRNLLPGPRASRRSRRHSDRSLPETTTTPDHTSLDEGSRHSLPSSRSRLQLRHSFVRAPPETTPATPDLISSEENSRHASLGPASSRKWAPPETTRTTPDPTSLEADSRQLSPGPRSSRRSQRTPDWAPPETTPTTPDPTLLEGGRHLPSGLSSRRSRRYSDRARLDSMPTPSPQPRPAASVTGAIQRRERRKSLQQTRESRLSRTGAVLEERSSFDEFE